MGEYSKSAIIKYTRKSLGITQEELSESVCDPVTLSRYESGKIDPSDSKFLRLMEKMGEKGSTFIFLMMSCVYWQRVVSLCQTMYCRMVTS